MIRCLFLLLILFSCFPTNAIAQNQSVPLDHFILPDEYSRPRLSPDGKYLALTKRVPVDGRDIPMVMVYSLPEMKEQCAVRMPIFEAPHNYQWVTNSRLLVTKAKEIGSREQPALTGEIFAMDFNGENQEYIYGYQEYLRRNGSKFGDYRGHAEIIDIPKKRDGHFYMSTILWDREVTSLFYVNAKNANRKLITTIDLPDATFVLQKNGTPRFAYGSNKENYTQLFKYDDKGDKWLAVPYEESGGYIIPIAFTEDDKEFYAFFRKQGEPSQLIRQNLMTGTRITVLESKSSELDISLNGVNQNMPFAFGSQVGIPDMQYIDSEASEAKLHKLLKSKFTDSFIDFINYTDDGSKLLFSVTSDKEPGAYFIFDKASGRASFLFASRQLIDPEKMADRQPIQFTTRDDIKIDGYLTIPPKHDRQKKMPLVVLPHGGPHGIADHWFYDNDAQFIASLGYAVLQVNFRGSGGKGNAFRISGHKKWGGEIQNDILDAVKWAIKERNVDPNRICTYGASFGGYSALMLAVREPDMFQCAIGYVGVYDLNLMFTTEEKSDPRYLATIKRYLGTDKSILDQFSPAKHADKIKIPVMLVHGIEDKRAPFIHAKVMREALIKQGRPPEWMAAEDEGHGFYNRKNVKEFYQRLESFLRKYLGH